jgi:hypothetical protein
VETTAARRNPGGDIEADPTFFRKTTIREKANRAGHGGHEARRPRCVVADGRTAADFAWPH